MIEKLKKFGRALRRDHLPLVNKFPIMGSVGGAVGSAIVRGTLSAASIIGTAVSVLLLAGISWGFRYRRLSKRTETSERVYDSGAIKTRKLEGPGAKIHTIESAQKLVTNMTRKYAQLQQLPPKVQKKVDAHIADAQEAASHVRLTLDDVEQREMPVLRVVFNAAGNPTLASAGTLTMQHTPTQDELDAQAKAAEAAKLAQGAAAAASIHAGSSEKLTVKPIKLKQPKKPKIRG